MEVITYESTPPLRLEVLDGGSHSTGVLIERSRGSAWSVVPGSPIEVVSPMRTLTPFGVQPRSRRLPVGGYLREAADGGSVSRLGLPQELSAGLFAWLDRRVDLELAQGARLEVVAQLGQRGGAARWCQGCEKTSGTKKKGRPLRY